MWRLSCYPFYLSPCRSCSKHSCNMILLFQHLFMLRPEAFVATSNDIFILLSCRDIEFLCRNLVSLLSNHSLSQHCFSVATRVIFFQCRDIQNDVLTRSFFEDFSLSQHLVSCRNILPLALVSLIVATLILCRNQVLCNLHCFLSRHITNVLQRILGFYLIDLVVTSSLCS